jgi:hypothetical protein
MITSFSWALSYRRHDVQQQENNQRQKHRPDTIKGISCTPKKARLAARLPAYCEQAGINKNCKIIKLGIIGGVY